MAEDNDKRLGYSPDIKYEEDYSSKIGTSSVGLGSYQIPELNPNKKDPTKPQFDPNFGIQLDNLMDEVAELTKALPDRIHVIVNSVFKPVYKDWKENIKGNVYPTYIPDPDDVIYVPYPGIIGGKPGDDDPSNGGGKPGDDDDDDPSNGGGDDPGGGGGDPGGGGIVPEDGNVPEPGDDDYPDPEPVDPGNGGFEDPEHYPEIGEDPYEDIYDNVDDESIDIDLPLDIFFPEINKMDIIKLEYVKNIMELYEYYTSQLKDALSSYYLQLVSAMVGVKSSRQMTFLLGDITEDMALDTADAEARTLMDASLRSEVMGNLKLDFLENMFKVESTLYHMKYFKAANELRQRYYSTDKNANDTKDAGTSAKVQEAMQMMYDRKYEDAYINYYKYLNSSLKVLEDAFKEQETGFKTKSTINNKK